MNTAFTAILIPLLGAFVVLALPKKYKGGFAVALLGLTFLACLFGIPAALKYKQLLFQKYFNEWFSLSFLVDGLSIFMAVVSSFVAFLISIYSLDYMKDYENKGEFYFWASLFVGAMMGLVFSANLILMYCFWEVTAVCSWRLIGFYRKDKDIKAADRAFLVTFFGASLLLIGIALVFINYGTLEIALLRGKPLADGIAFLLLAGVLAKSAQLPLQTWLPDAGVAPTPVTALLHAAVLVKIGVYAFARIFNMTFYPSQHFLNVAMGIAAATILVGGAAALVENNMKRILAYSTISQLGYILLALCLRGNIALKIALLYILAHSLAKAGLFLCAGIIEHKTHTKDINELGGLYKAMPRTACAYMLCAFSIIGIPPFLGFWPKFFVVLGAAKEGYILASSIAVIGALFTLFYLLRLFDKVFLGKVQIEAQEEKHSAPVYVVLILGVLSLALGLAVKAPLGILTQLIK